MVGCDRQRETANPTIADKLLVEFITLTARLTLL
jgi:hypothetical protein